MICTNKLIFDWYKQTKAGVIPAMFKAAHLRERRISIHEVVNSNGYTPTTKKQLELNNTMALLHLWRRRSALWEILTARHGEKHAVTMARLNRRHLKACNRK